MEQLTSFELTLHPFQAVTVTPLDGSTQVTASVKVRGQRYFLSFGIKCRDAVPAVAAFSSRIETFCGKPVRSKANIELEGLMDTLKEAALKAVGTNLKGEL
jgi:hypothetical protein